MEESQPPIHVAMSRVMADMKAIEKKNRNQQQGYAFRGIDDVFNELQPVLVEHGVWYTPEEIISNEHEWRQTQKGGWQHSTVLRIRYRFYGPAGDSVTMESIGESADPADKSTQQAMSQALKSGLLQTFCIRTHESAKNDPDANSPASGGPVQRTVDLRPYIASVDLTDAEREALKQAWKDEPSLPFPAGQVPASREQECRTFIDSFVGTEGFAKAGGQAAADAETAMVPQ